MPALPRFATLLPLLLVTALPRPAQAIGGTSQVANRGQAAYLSPHYPGGVKELLADATRGDGFNDWFSEWPNDVNQYQFHPENTDQLNRVIALFSRIQSKSLEIRLSPDREPRGFGWVSRFPEGNQTPLVFSIGDQTQIDAWYAQLDGQRFGTMEFTATPVAVPPTLTIFVRHKAVNLDQLQIPAHVRVITGNIPTVFREWNLKHRDKTTPRTSPQSVVPPAPDAEAAQRHIEAFLDRRKNDRSLP